MKSYILLITVIIFANFKIYAQLNATVSGQIKDKKTNEYIPYASVAILSENDKLVNGSITNNEGHFTIKGLEAGKYKITVSYLGYYAYQSNILIGKLNQYYDLGKIELERSTTQLEEVTITGERGEIAVGLDKKSYDMSNTIAQSGGSVMDVMKAMPGISFDQEGKVILRGSNKVVVLIDSKQSSLTGYGNQKGLDNIPAANIERIEIINNPSAKYDASGMAGISILFTKKKNNPVFTEVQVLLMDWERLQSVKMIC